MTDSYMTIDEVAGELDVSAARVRQMIQERKLPQPIVFGQRTRLFRRPDVWATLQRLREGNNATLPVGLLLGASLPRVFEGVIDLADARPWDGSVPVCHVRVWSGAAPEGVRTVVVFGCPEDNPDVHVTWVEDAVATIDREVLGGTGADAVWIEYRPPHRSVGGEAHDLENMLATVEPDTAGRSDDSQLPPRPRRATSPWRLSLLNPADQRDSETVVANRFSSPRWSKVSHADFAQLVGEHLECYPKHTYTIATIHQRTAASGDEPIEVQFDARFDLDQHLLAIENLERHLTGDRHAPATHAATAWAWMARALLRADSTRAFSDGTENEMSTADWPTRWAARRIEPTVPSADLSLIENLAEQHRELTEQEAFSVLDELDAWMSELSTLQPPGGEGLFEALVGAYSFIRRGNAPNYQPAHVASDFFKINSEIDREYLATVDWSGRSPTTPGHILGELSRRGDDALRQQQMSHLDKVLVGSDPVGRTVVLAGECFALEWPTLRTVNDQADPPPDLTVVGGTTDAGGCRPVFVRSADGIGPLPLDIDRWDTNSPRPRSFRHPGETPHWSFGHPGETAIALRNAIASYAARRLNLDESVIPHHYIDDEVLHAGNELRISLDSILRRCKRN